MIREMAGFRPDGGSIMIVVVKIILLQLQNAYLGIKHIRTLATSPTIDPTVCSGGGPSWPPQWVSGSLPGQLLLSGSLPGQPTTATKRRLPRQKTHPHARDVTNH